MNAPQAVPSGMEFTEDEVARLLRQFDVTRLEDPLGAEAYCRALESWLAEQDRGAIDLDRLAADLWFMQGMLGQARGDIEGSIEQLQRSISESERIGYERRRILGLRALAMCLENAGMQAESTARIAEALDLANDFGDDTVLALVSLTLAALYQAQGAWSHLLDASFRTVEIAERVDDPHLVSRAYSGVSIAFGHDLRIDEGLDWNDRARALIADRGGRVEQLYLELNRWFLFRKAGDVAEAAAIAERLVGEIDSLPAADGARLAVQIAETRLNTGDLTGAEAMLRRSDEIVHDQPMTAHLIAYHDVWARLHEAMGDPRSALVSLRQQLDAERELRGRNAQARLVTVERRLERLLAAKTEEVHQLRNVELAALNHQKDEILHVVAHDLRNPLAVAQMLSDSLLSGRTEDPEDERAQLDMIREAVTEMGATIDVLLHPLLGESPRVLADVAAVVRGSIGGIGDSARQQDIDLVERIEPADMNVDSALLKRCIDDLLLMAVRTSGPGSSISVAVEPHEDRTRVTLSGPFQIEGADRSTIHLARRLVERMSGSLTVAEFDDGIGSIVIELRGA